MRISAHTFVTNPRSQGYLAYLPAIQSFLDFADEVIVVDGGSTDGSIEALARLRGSERLRVFSSDRTFWAPGDAWEMPQYGIQRQVGLELCTGDWAIAFDADHVLPEFEGPPLREQLARHADEGVLYAFRVVACRGARYAPDKKIRRWCINKRLARERGTPIGWGLKHRTGGGERPIYLEHENLYVDPATRTPKRYHTGAPFPEDGIMDVRLYKYGHFFYSSEQLRAKLQRYENGRARLEGRPPRPVEPDARPYALVDARTFLEKERHPRAMREFLAEYVRTAGGDGIDVVGLRRYREDAAARRVMSAGPLVAMLERVRSLTSRGARPPA